MPQRRQNQGEILTYNLIQVSRNVSKKMFLFFPVILLSASLSYAQLAGNYCGEKNKGIKVLEFILKNKSEKKKIRIYKQSLHVGHRHCTEVKIFCDGKSMCYFPIV